MTKDEALKLALEALERGETKLRWEAITVIKEALAQPEQEPVATVIKKGAYRQWMSVALGQLPDGTYSLYTTLPQRKPLTDEQIYKTGNDLFYGNGPCDTIPVTDDMKPADPISENMAFLKGKPTKAFIYQDHEAHIAAHSAFARAIEAKLKEKT